MFRLSGCRSKRNDLHRSIHLKHSVPIKILLPTRVIPNRVDDEGPREGRIETDSDLGGSIAIGEIPRLRSDDKTWRESPALGTGPAGQLRLA